MTNLADVYFKALNFHKHVAISKHVCNRIIERNVPIETFVNDLKTKVISKMCEVIYDHTIGTSAYDNYGGVKVRCNGFTMIIRFMPETMKLTVCTVYFKY